MLVEINCQMKPIRRYDHTATLIDSKLYILGGLIANEDAQKNFFYLDVSVEFSTQNLLWQDLSGINIVPPHCCAVSVKGGANNSTLFLYGGEPYPSETESLVYTFNPQSNSWTIPKIAGTNTIRKKGLTGIIDNNGKMYLWGGLRVDDGGITNEMLILDTINLSWESGNIVGAPTPRTDYAAVLLPNNKIIYMGKCK